MSEEIKEKSVDEEEAETVTVPAESIMEALNKCAAPDTEFHYCGTDIHVKRRLSFEEMMEFVNSVVSVCFNDVDDERVYTPEVRDFMWRSCILTLYANIELPGETEKAYDAVYSTDLVNRIIECVNQEQLSAISEAIDRKIQCTLQNDAAAFKKRLDDALDKLDSIEDVVESVFKGIDSDTIGKIAGAVADGKFDEGKLVQAFKNSTAE